MLALLANPLVAFAGPIMICDTQPNIDYACKNCTPKSTELPFALFDFTHQPNITSLSQIELTMSMQVGNPGLTNLHLALDGIDTGLKLTGFQKDSLIQQTFTIKAGDPGFMSASNVATLLKDVKNGEIAASLIGATPDDLKVQLYSDTNVQLCLTGNPGTSSSSTPEPASLLVWALCACALCFVRCRRGLAV
jgi:hypothetical protein